MIAGLLKQEIQKALATLELKEDEVALEHPTDLSHGDYSSNIALVLGKKLKREPLSLALEIVAKLSEQLPAEVSKVEVAGAGFINFYLSVKFFADQASEIVARQLAGDNFGRNTLLKDRLILVEYTDPNPFKQFHIGHLMSNTIGESIARLISFAGANVKRVCYQGDAGFHVAVAIWGIRLMSKPFPEESASLEEKIKYLGDVYALGATKYKEVEGGESEIKLINQKIYDQSDGEVNELYDKGREWSLQYFEEIYKKLGTQFDHYFFESQAAPRGKEIVQKFLKKGIFEESEGAIIFPESKSGLHTRVFINSQGLPTYEAKELALAEMKHEVFPYDLSIVVTANEINDYFKVLLKALEFISPKLAELTQHISHGILKLPSGKMSSRTGDVISADSLLTEVSGRVVDKMKDRNFSEEERQNIAEIVSVGAIKYSILKQKTGKDIIFNIDQALSFEGDSGPYLQYTHTRAESVLKKATEAGIKSAVKTRSDSPGETLSLEHWLYRFTEVVERALNEMEPHYVTTYLVELAGAFNNFYANFQIIDPKDPNSSYRLLLTQATSIVLKNGLFLLGIRVPDRM